MQDRNSLKQLLATTILFSLAVGANAAPAGAGPARGAADAEHTAFNYFVNKGLTKVQAAGIIGNLMQESSVRATAAQFGGGPGRGIAQWEIGHRWDKDSRDNVVWFANLHKDQLWALNTQLDFIWYELMTFQNYGLQSLRTARTVSDAVKAFQDRFEICRKESCDESQRIAFANRALKAYGGGR